MKFKKLTVALDMYGCPNRCKHCWVGHSKNGNMTEADLIFVAQAFRPYTEMIEVFDWYREPDYKDNYERLYALRSELSDFVTPHFELLSVYRAVRDDKYIKWLYSLGLRAAQLTLFGGEQKTDYYTGRHGSYKEILKTIDLLTGSGISPRLQIFVNKDNIDELPLIEKLIASNRYVERCKSIGGEFRCFVHQGSCDGENEKLYDIRVTPDDLKKIPTVIKDMTLEYMNAPDLSAVFGQTECALYNEFADDQTHINCVETEPTFLVDCNYNVYPNVSTPMPSRCLGNLKTDGAQKIVDAYINNKSLAQKVCATVRIANLVRSVGDSKSLRLFTKDDYLVYIVNKYCKNIPKV